MAVTCLHAALSPSASRAANPHKTQLFAQLTTQFGSFAPLPLPLFLFLWLSLSLSLFAAPHSTCQIFLSLCLGLTSLSLSLLSLARQCMQTDGRHASCLVLLPARSPLDVVLSLQKFQTQRPIPLCTPLWAHTGVDSDLICCWGQQGTGQGGS